MGEKLGEKVRIKQHSVERNQCVAESLLRLIPSVLTNRDTDTVEKESSSTMNSDDDAPLSGIKRLFRMNKEKKKVPKKYRSFIETIVTICSRCLEQQKPISHDLFLLAYRCQIS